MNSNQQQLVELARMVAMHQRGENHLQSVEVLSMKLARECYEFAEVNTQRPLRWQSLLAEAGDIVYYHAQLLEQGVDISPVVGWILQTADIPVTMEDAEKAALAKYRLRASAPNTKDHEAEEAAIESAFPEQEKPMPKTVEPTKEQLVSWLETLWREQREDDVQAGRGPFSYTIIKVQRLVDFPLWLVEYWLSWTDAGVNATVRSFHIVQQLSSGRLSFVLGTDL